MGAAGMVLNELSVEVAAGDKYIARARMKALAETASVAVKFGASPVLRTLHCFVTTPLAPDYTFLRWQNDSAVDRDESRLLGRLASKGPFLDDYDYGADVEFKFGSTRVLGLGGCC